jgi:transposase-like protein
VLVQSKRDKHATLKLMRKLLKKYAFVPERLVTDDLRSYAPAASDLGIEHLHECSRCRTVGPRTHINRPDGGRARCSASRAPAPRRNSSQPTQPCTTPSPSNASHLSSTTSRAPRPGD